MAEMKCQVLYLDDNIEPNGTQARNEHIADYGFDFNGQFWKTELINSFV